MAAFPQDETSRMVTRCLEVCPVFDKIFDKIIRWSLKLVGRLSGRTVTFESSLLAFQ